MFSEHLKSPTDLIEILENQRFYGVAWAPPLLPYDPPAWSDSMGGPIGLGRPPPSIDGEGGWFVVRTESTDEEGWIYGTAFSHLEVSYLMEGRWETLKLDF